MHHVARAFALIALLACAAAQPGRPLVSETADGNPRGLCDVQSAFTRDSQRDAPDTLCEIDSSEIDSSEIDSSEIDSYRVHPLVRHRAPPQISPA